MKFLYPAMIACMTFMFAAPAYADKAAYCAAYARDFADALTKDKSLWQHKYDIALGACLGTKPPREAQVKAAPKSQKKVVVKRNVDPPKAVAVTPTENAPIKLVEGSSDWKTYCANKYTSFNPKTGTYTSKTGVERKCSVSAN
jgi:ribonucleotide reductase alpha subunit